MIISPILNSSNFYYSKSYVKTKQTITFKGQVDDEFFKAVKAGDVSKQLKCLSNIGFDINGYDIETGDNFLHSAIKTGNKQIVNKAIILLGQKTNNHPELANNILNQCNNENKKPYECTTDKVLLEIIARRMGKEISELQPQSIPVETYKAINDVQDKPIDLPNMDDIDIEEDYLSTKVPENASSSVLNDKFEARDILPLDDIAGLTKAKKILTNKIVQPLKSGKNVTDNGFLLHGPSGSGKGFLLQSLAKSLNKDVIVVKKLEQLIDEALTESNSKADENINKTSDVKNNKGNENIAKIFDENIIKVEDVQQLESVIDFAKENYKNTGKQAIIYIDEIKGILPDVDAVLSNSVTKAEQLIENSSAQGFVIIATTREKNAISPASIREGRFDNHIELKFPDSNERKEIFAKYLSLYQNYNENAFKKIINKTSGFSYRNLRTIINNINDLNEPNLDDIEKLIIKYAKDNDFGELSDEGTTANYDSVEFKREPLSKLPTFKDVAGMEDVKTAFRDLIIDRIKPDALNRFKNSKIPPINFGFILYGPKGTGKTFIVEALAGESKIPLYKLDSATFESSLVGETEKNLAKIFKQLETKFEETGEYSILLIDEADGILKDRSKSNEFNKKITNELLKHLNNAGKRGIIAIAATNYFDEIDSAIQDRLTTAISIQPPSQKMREVIIKNLFNNEIITKDIDEEGIQSIAKSLAGFSSREITAILSNTMATKIKEDNSPISVETFKKAISKYAVEHNIAEINERNTTSKYDTFIQRTQIKSSNPQSLDDIGGMNEAKEALNEAMLEFIDPDTKIAMQEDGDQPSNGILLYGPPGCGKTFIMKALAAQSNMPLYEVKLSEIGSKWVNESENNLKKIFNQLRTKYRNTDTHEASILFFDECDNFFRNVANSNESYRTGIINTLKEEMQNAGQDGIFIVAATNEIENLNDALVRDGRFDRKIKIDYPDAQARKEVLSKILASKKRTKHILENPENIKILVEKTNGFSNATISTVINECSKHARKNNSFVAMDDLLNTIGRKKVENNKIKNNKPENILEQLMFLASKLSQEEADKFKKLFFSFESQETTDEENN